MGFLRKLWQGVVALAVREEGQVPSSLTDSYDALLTTTLRNYQPKMRDNITRGNKLVSWLKSKGRTRKVDGGERVQIPLMHAQNATADIYSGYGLLDTTPTDGITSAFYEWAQLSVSISIARREKRQNSGKHKALDLLEAKTMQSEASLKELLNNCLVAGRITSGVSGASGQFSARVGRLDSGAAGPLPLAVLIDVTNSRSVAVGNINPNTYSFWRNVATSSTGTTWAAFKSEMNAMYNTCARGSAGAPDLIIADQTGWETYWAALQTQERYIIDSKETVDVLGGSDALKFRGAAIVWDEVVPDPETNAEVVSAVGTMTASTMYFINSEAWEYIVDSQTDMITTPFLRPENQDASVAQILHMCCVGVNNRRKNGVLYGISRSIVA